MRRRQWGMEVSKGDHNEKCSSRQRTRDPPGLAHHALVTQAAVWVVWVMLRLLPVAGAAASRVSNTTIQLSRQAKLSWLPC